MKLLITWIVVLTGVLFSSLSFAEPPADQPEASDAVYFYNKSDADKQFGTSVSNDDLQKAIIDGRLPSVRVQLIRTKSSTPKKPWEYSYSFDSISRDKNKAVAKKIRSSVLLGSDEDKDSVEAKSQTGKLLYLYKHATSGFLSSSQNIPAIVSGLERDEKLLREEAAFKNNGETPPSAANKKAKPGTKKN